jgi:hypothetical protein
VAPDEDEPAARPRKKVAPLDEEEDVLPAKKKKAAALDDEEEDVRPAKKKPAALADEDEDEAPAKPAKKKAAVEEEDEDDRPARPKKRRPVDEDEDEEEDEEEDRPRKGKRRTPWYVMLPLLVLSFCGIGLAWMWTLGFTWLELDKGLDLSFDSRMWIGIGTGAGTTLLCLIFSLIPVRAWLRFLLVLLFLGIGYGGSFAAIHWWKDLPFSMNSPPAPPRSLVHSGGSGNRPANTASHQAAARKTVSWASIPAPTS